MLLIAFAFSTSAAFKPVPTIAELQLQAFLLSGGSIDDLCGHEGGLAHIDCDICCHAPSLPALHQPSIFEADQTYLAQVILPQAALAANKIHDPSAPVRGPPNLL